MCDREQAANSDLDTIAKAIGLVVLQWGQAEQSLDLLVAVLWQSFDGKRFAKKIPVMLEPKIRFIRACVAADHRLKEHAKATTDLLVQFEQLSSLRHDLIHGAVASISPIGDAFVFAKLEVRDGFHHHREVRIEASEYPRLMKRLVALGRDAIALSTQVFDVAKTDSPRIR
jgi:hypothetical protein